MIDRKRLIVILGPTASGKTTFACNMALQCDGEIISGDSRQVYRRMDLGTGKDISDYQIGNHIVPYHLIDICEPGTKYNLFEYQRDFLLAYNDIVSRNKCPILCGGTGLYLEAVVKGYNLSAVPQNESLRKQLEGKTLDELTIILRRLKERNGNVMHNTTDIDSSQRAIRAIEIEEYNSHTPTDLRQFPALKSVIIGLQIDREERRKRITMRLKERLDAGMVDEVKRLLDEGISPDNLMYYGLEYKYLTEYVIGKTTYSEMVGRLEIAIHQFAKRQMTWFRGMERRGFTIHWIDAMLPMEEKIERAMRVIEEK